MKKGKEERKKNGRKGGRKNTGSCWTLDFITF